MLIFVVLESRCDNSFLTKWQQTSSELRHTKAHN